MMTRHALAEPGPAFPRDLSKEAERLQDRHGCWGVLSEVDLVLETVAVMP